MKKIIVILLLNFATSQPLQYFSSPCSNDIIEVPHNSRVKNFLVQVAQKKGKDPQEIVFKYDPWDNNTFSVSAQKKFYPSRPHDEITISNGLYSLINDSLLEGHYYVACKDANAYISLSPARAQGIATAIIEHEIRHLEQDPNQHLQHMDDYIKRYFLRTVPAWSIITGSLLSSRMYQSKVMNYALAGTIGYLGYSMYKLWHDYKISYGQMCRANEFDADQGITDSLYTLESFRIMLEIGNLNLLHGSCPQEYSQFKSHPDLNSRPLCFKKSCAILQSFYKAKYPNDTHPSYSERHQITEDRIQNLINQGHSTCNLDPVAVVMIDETTKERFYYTLQ